MGFKENWKRLVAWWANNAKSNEKKLSSGFSWLLVVIISNLLTPIVTYLKSGVPDWNAFFIVCIIALVSYSIMVIESVFGRKEAPSATPIVTASVDPEPVDSTPPA